MNTKQILPRIGAVLEELVMARVIEETRHIQNKCDVVRGHLVATRTELGNVRAELDAMRTRAEGAEASLREISKLVILQHRPDLVDNSIKTAPVTP